MVRWVTILVLLLGIAVHWIWQVKNQPQLKIGQRVRLTFTVSQEPKIKFGQEYLNFKGINVPIPIGLNVHYGDYIQVVGEIDERGLITEDFQVSPSKGSVSMTLNRLRQWGIGNIQKYLPPNEAGLAAGMLFGGTEDMSASQIIQYRRAGLSHIVAASGYNVTLVGIWVAEIFRRLLSRKYAILFVILVITLYSIMAGGTASVVRAAIMSIIASVGMLLGRETDIKWVLVLATLGMLLVNPSYLADIGFQLSVAATAGLVFFSPKSVWWTTIAAQIATMPLILHHFGNLSLIAPLANILVLWTVPLIMQVSALAVVTGGFLGYLVWPLLKWCNLVTGYLASFHYSSLSVAPMSWVWVAGYYLVLLIVYKLRFEAKN